MSLYTYIYVHMYETNIFFLLIFKIIKWKITVNLTHSNFRHSSVGEQFACNAGDPGLIPALGRSAGEGIGYPLQYSWASLVAQLVKNNCNEGDLRWEDPPEKGKATHSNILIWRIPWATVHGITKCWTRLSKFHFHTHMYMYVYVFYYT